MHHCKIAGLGLLMITMVSGCHEKSGQTDAPLSADKTVATNPVPAGAPISTDIKQSLAESAAALKAGAYEKAAQNLVAVQKQGQLTVQQAQQAYNQMAQLQGSLAAAIANGDPNAKAAAEFLRKSALNR